LNRLCQTALSGRWRRSFSTDARIVLSVAEGFHVAWLERNLALPDAVTPKAKVRGGLLQAVSADTPGRCGKNVREG
jgi:hypothetical protein